MIKKIAAQYVFTNTGAPIKNGVVAYNDTNGEIVAITQLQKETANTVFYNGILVPGFVNAHCHLELAYTKGLIPQCKHLTDFLRQITQIQNSTKFNIADCIDADNEMYKNGINAVGDISNTEQSASVKANSKIRYYNFVELIGTTSERINLNRQTYQKVANSFADKGLKDICAVPHSPYFVSNNQFDDINNLNVNNKKVVSIHNQETNAENELFVNHTGDFAKYFPSMTANIAVTGKKSLPSYCQHLAEYQNVLLIHNTFSTREDFKYALETLNNPFFVLCPKSNLYLEGRLPDVDTMLDMNLTLCIGTDSLSSNNTLSILEEMKILALKFKRLTFEKLLQMATINGAKALMLNNEYGTLEIGQQPGLLLIENFDFLSFNICNDTTIKRIC